jgi:hypothetical protein
MAALDISREGLMKDYSINEYQLKDFLFGTPGKSDEGIFHSIYDDLKVKMDDKVKESNRRALVKLSKSSKAIEN